MNRTSRNAAPAGVTVSTRAVGERPDPRTRPGSRASVPRSAGNVNAIASTQPSVAVVTSVSSWSTAGRGLSLVSVLPTVGHDDVVEVLPLVDVVLVDDVEVVFPDRSRPSRRHHRCRRTARPTAPARSKARFGARRSPASSSGRAHSAPARRPSSERYDPRAPIRERPSARRSRPLEGPVAQLAGHRCRHRRGGALTARPPQRRSLDGAPRRPARRRAGRARSSGRASTPPRSVSSSAAA